MTELRALHTAVYNALARFPQADQFRSLDHAHVRNLLADHLTGALYHDGWVQRDKEKATPAGTTVTPELTGRQAWLLAHVRLVGGRWKTGRVTDLYRRNHITATRGEAGADLMALRDRGDLRQHDEDGVRYFELVQRGDRR
ncbi:hypothetical protein ACH40F_08310 [Streptomyces sp. NPDC020794]|uniref:hypothetical protein n=1 Tax=unclassified Streptomyces TaxID=2593676 RepID=UPI0036E9FC78